MTARGWGIVVAVGVLAAAGVSPAGAEGDGLDRIIPESALVLNKGVQKELKLSEDQIKEATPIALGMLVAIQQGIRTLRQEIEDKAEQNRRAGQMIRDQHAAAAAKLKDVLSDKQWARLKQIHLWRTGIFTIRVPAIESALKLTDEQKAKLERIVREGQSERPTPAAFMAANPDATREQWEDAVKVVDDRTMARQVKVLDPQQRAQWSEILGPPFEYKPDGPNQPPR
jgi:hypothetical protein